MVDDDALHDGVGRHGEERQSERSLASETLQSVMAWGREATTDRDHPANPVTVKASGRERTPDAVDERPAWVARGRVGRLGLEPRTDGL